MGSSQTPGSYLVVCINNEDYPASLVLRKIYRCIPDADARSQQQVRVVDESGDDYLYPAELFVRISLPEKAEKALFQTTAKA